MLTLFRKTYVFILILLFSLSSLWGQSLFDSLMEDSVEQKSEKSAFEVGGFARGVAQGGAKDFDYSNAFGEFGLKGRYEKDKVLLFADFRIRDGLFYNNHELQLQLKEAYVSYRTRNLDLTLGNQIVMWGRTDGFNPTNNITPNDYFLLTYDPDDQKLPNFMLRTKWRPTGFMDLDVTLIPFYKPSIYRYDLFNMGLPAFFEPTAQPASKFENGSAAARLNFEFSQIGFSTSYFIGHNPFYGFQFNDFSIYPLGVNIVPKPYFTQILGADFAIPISSWLVRGEMALNLPKDYEVRENTHIPNPEFSYVVGVEKTFWDVVTIFQYVGRYTFHHKTLVEPLLSDYETADIVNYIDDLILFETGVYNQKIFSQHTRMNYMLFLALNRSFLYDQLNVEMAGTYNISTEEYMVRGRLRWSITDDLAANVGCNFMLGPKESIYHLSGRVMNGVFLGLEVSF